MSLKTYAIVGLFGWALALAAAVGYLVVTKNGQVCRDAQAVALAEYDVLTAHNAETIRALGVAVTEPSLDTMLDARVALAATTSQIDVTQTAVDAVKEVCGDDD